MFARNMGATDRVVRAVVGVVAIVLFFTLAGGLKWLALAVGLLMLVTAGLGHCPPYRMLGISTCKNR